MKFGIITPVYDKCFESTELLYENLKQQTHADWSWLICSNGYSKLYADFVSKKNKDDPLKRITYLSSNYQELTNNCFSVIANIGKRRKLCIQEIDCHYLFLFDADAKILDKRMFEIINQNLTDRPKKLCLYYIKHNFGYMPSFPISDGNLDLLNFCVRADVAKKIGYPTTVDLLIPANDYKFFVKCYKACRGDAVIINRVFCEYNGNNRYNTARKMVTQMQTTKRSTTKQFLAYSLLNYRLGLFKALKDYLFAVNVLPYETVFSRNVFSKMPPAKAAKSSLNHAFFLSSDIEKEKHTPKFENYDTNQVLQASWIAEDGTLYASSFNTIYKSTDGGSTCQDLKAFRCNGIESIHVSKDDKIFASPGVDAALSDSGLWRSADYGASWIKVLSLPLSSSIWAIDEDNNGKLYAGVYTRGPRNARIYISSDSGVTWNLSYFDPKARHIHDITVDKQNNYVYASVGDKCVPESNVAYIIRSVDGGKHWIKILKHLPQIVAIETLPETRLFGTDDCGNGQIFLSSDDKEFRKVLDTGAKSYCFWIRHNIVNGKTYASFVGGEENPKNAGIFVSGDGGLTWSIYRSFDTNTQYEGSSRSSNFRKGQLYYSIRLDGTQRKGSKINFMQTT